MHLLLIPLLAAGATAPERITWDVNGLERSALILVPSDRAQPAPVVFVFHGHGGSSENAARSFHLRDLWAEAIVVYPQGVPTAGRLTDPEGKRTGWQHAAGEQQDRDLAFFDRMLEWLRQEHQIDERRIYATGHSNGGGFTYLLWQQRPGVFAAVAPSAAGGRAARDVSPLPAMHVAGREDTLVRFDWQQRTMAVVRRINGCAAEGREWAEHAMIYPSPSGTPFVAVIHPGGHKFYDKAPPLIVRFFKENVRGEVGQSDRQRQLSE